jgi:hypothetical protein
VVGERTSSAMNWNEYQQKKLAKLWNSMTPEERRRKIVGNSFLSFKEWKKLAPQERQKVMDRIVFNGDVEYLAMLIKRFSGRYL